MGSDDLREEAKDTAFENVDGNEPEDLNSTKADDEISWDDVQEELAAGANPPAEQKVGSVKFKEMQESEGSGSVLDMDFILDIPLTVSVELGRGKMMISELLKLGRGSVVELTKLAGEPLDVFVNNRLIAIGEVVVTNEKFGVRLTEVVSHAERIDKLK
jgi:flagellar motor switch protein FliN/FliY